MMSLSLPSILSPKSRKFASTVSRSTISKISEELNTGVMTDVSLSPFVPIKGTISGFLYLRFREEFLPAVDAWLATEPVTNVAAPKTPFTMSEYLVAERVKAMPNGIVVSGHTDNVAMASARFPSNWELAGARASGVVRLLEHGGVASERLSAVSHGETSPRASNDTAAGRTRNRRIEIMLKPARQAGPDESELGAEGGEPAEPATAQ